MLNRFTRLYGNDGIKNRICTAIESKRLPHAFLIDGQQGSGKFTLALEIAAALNCEHKTDKSYPLPCGKCNNCRRIYEGIFVDVKLLSRSEHRETIGVEEVAELKKDMFLSATESDYKIYIIRDAERLTPQAQNSLLIVLEEPPRNVLIMLLASGTDRILTTIKSRTQYIAMSRFSREEIENYLIIERGAAATVARAAAMGADGRIGCALQLLDPTEAREELDRRSAIDEFISILAPKTPFARIYEVITSMPKKRADFSEMLEGILTALCDLIIQKRSPDTDTVYYESREAAVMAGEKLNLTRLLRISDVINEAHVDCSKNANVGAMQINLASKIKLI